MTAEPNEHLPAIRLKLLQLHIAEREPRWSSWMLDRLWESVLSVQGALPSDLYKTLFDLFAEYQYELTELTGNFIRDIVKAGRAARHKFKSCHLRNHRLTFAYTSCTSPTIHFLSS
jgi:hypothetical protein